MSESYEDFSVEDYFPRDSHCDQQGQSNDAQMLSTSFFPVQIEIEIVLPTNGDGKKCGINIKNGSKFHAGRLRIIPNNVAIPLLEIALIVVGTDLECDPVPIYKIGEKVEKYLAKHSGDIIACTMKPNLLVKGNCGDVINESIQITSDCYYFMYQIDQLSRKGPGDYRFQATVVTEGNRDNLTHSAPNSVFYSDTFRVIHSSSVQDIQGTVKEIINSEAKKLCHEESLYLYLVDEMTLQPVVRIDDSVFPIEITTQSELIRSLLPWMKVGFSAACLINSATGIAQLLGYPVPHVSSENMTQVNNSLARLGQATSIGEHQLIEAMLKKP